MPFWVTPHSPKHLSDEQREYITRFLTEANDAIYCSDKSSTKWEEYIDIDALAVFYIVQEAVDNPEAFSGSCYMYKQRGDSTKLIFGPLWDCGSSFHRFGSTYQFDDFIYENMPSYCRSRWIISRRWIQTLTLTIRLFGISTVRRRLWRRSASGW